MSAIDLAMKLTKESEGCELVAYPDPATHGAPYTVGWGSTRLNGLAVKPLQHITQGQADAQLAQDLSRCIDNVKTLTGNHLNDYQVAACADFVYNVGLGNFSTSTMLVLLKQGRLSDAADQFARWNKAAGKVMNGLTKRRAAEAALFRTGMK